MSLEEQEVRQEIERGNLREAIEAFRAYRSDEVAATLYSRYQAYLKKKSAGVFSPMEETQQENILRADLLNALSGRPISSDPDTDLDDAHSLIGRIVVGVIAFLLVLIAGLFLFKVF